MNPRPVEVTLTIEQRHHVLDIILAHWISHHPQQLLRNVTVLDFCAWHFEQVLAAKGATGPTPEPLAPKSEEP